MADFESVISSDVPLLPIDEEKSEELAEAELEEDRLEAEIGGLKGNRGWTALRNKILLDIEGLEKHSGVELNTMTNAELGEVVRTDLMVAEKLRNYVMMVELASEANPQAEEEDSDDE